MDLAPYIEHTALKATVTPGQIETLCEEARRAGFAGVCVSPSYVPLARRRLAGSLQRLVTVVGFPLGANRTAIKAEEARVAIADGADEIDMVAHVGLARDGNWDAVEADIAAVRGAIGNAPLKVILETGYFEPEELEHLAETALRAGADYLKTSTGFGPRGASVADVERLVRVARGRAQVKASGGIRDARTARELVSAGATRLGTSNGMALLA